MRPFRVFLATASLCLSLFPAVAQVKESGGDSGKAAGKSAWLTLSPEQKAQTLAFADPYRDYLRHAKSAALSEAELTRLAHAARFEDFT